MRKTVGCRVVCIKVVVQGKGGTEGGSDTVVYTMKSTGLRTEPWGRNTTGGGITKTIKWYYI